MDAIGYAELALSVLEYLNDNCECLCFSALKVMRKVFHPEMEVSKKYLKTKRDAVFVRSKINLYIFFIFLDIDTVINSTSNLKIA